MILNHVVEGAGRPVLLLHPVGIDLSFLAPLAALFAKRYRVMRMDLRGHGGSPLMPLAHDLGDFADDVHDTLAHTRFGPCAVVGFSFGGMVAQTLALRHAADVSALIPCAGPCTQTSEGRIVAASRGIDALERGMGVVLEAAMDRWFTPAFRASGGADAAEKYLRARCAWLGAGLESDRCDRHASASAAGLRSDPVYRRRARQVISAGKGEDDRRRRSRCAVQGGCWRAAHVVHRATRGGGARNHRLSGGLSVARRLFDRGQAGRLAWS